MDTKHDCLENVFPETDMAILGIYVKLQMR